MRKIKILLFLAILPVSLIRVMAKSRVYGSIILASAMDRLRRLFRAFLLVPAVTGTGRISAPSVAMVFELARNSAMKPFPTLSPLFYPGKLVITLTFLDSIVEMWEDLFSLATSQTPPMSGGKYFSLPQASSS